ncbi:MAG: leucine-rich repeat domain-containing protein [Treponema sp.]|nr:leucine-rich repeat domain-containing protein [Treponema sp.]
MPDSVTSIGDWAFSSCTSLTSVSIGDSVTSIGDYVFRSCESLTSVNIPDSVTSIGFWAFSDCSSLTSVTFEGAISSDGFNANAFSGLGDLRNKYLAGGVGTYTRPSGTSTTWTKQ